MALDYHVWLEMHDARQSQARAVASGGRSALARFRRKVREAGWLYSLQLAAERIVPGWLAEGGWFYLCELDLDTLEEPALADLSIRKSHRDDVALLRGFDYVDPAMLAALGSDGEVWFAIRNDSPLAYMWFEAADQNWASWLRLAIGPGEIAGVYLHVAVACRDEGVGPRLNRYVSCRLRDAGFKRVVSYVDCLNRNSLHSDRKVGYRLICPVVALRVFGLALVRIGPRVRLGWWSSRRPLVVSFEEARAVASGRR